MAIYDVFYDEDDLVIVMEFVEGQTLREALRRGRLPTDEAIRVLSAVGAALDHAHAHGIVHRDVKPANILLGRNGAVKLADLGVAAAADRTRITTSGALLGTVGYMAPEQVEGAAPQPSADIYTLAAVAFELLSGRRARSQDNPLAVAHAITTEPPPDLTEAWPEAPPEAAAVLSRAMARDPAERPRSASELISRLAVALEPQVTEEATPRRARRRRPPAPDADSVSRRAPARPSAGAIAAGGAAAAGLAAAAAAEGAAPVRESAALQPDGSAPARESAALQPDGSAPAREPSPPPRAARGATPARESNLPLRGGDGVIPARESSAPQEAAAGGAARAREDTPSRRAAAGGAARAREDTPSRRAAAGTLRPSAAAPARPPRDGRRPRPSWPWPRSWWPPSSWRWCSPPARARAARRAPRRPLARTPRPSTLLQAGAPPAGRRPPAPRPGRRPDRRPDVGELNGGVRERDGGIRRLGGTGSSAGSAAASGGAGDPGRAVETSDELAAAHQYQPAWALADPPFRAQLLGFSSFQAQQSHVRSLTFNSAKVTGQSASGATVAVQTTPVLDSGTQHCQGTVDVVPGGGGWLLHHISIGCP